jgi:hypothetical protein
MRAASIFISYRRKDSAAPYAISTCQYLEKEFGRKNVFIDLDMTAGSKFPEVLERRLNKCKVLIALIGPEWLTSKNDEGGRRLDDPNDWVRLELARALKRGITVIPVCVGGAELPKKPTLPEDLHSLLDHQAATVSFASFRNDMSGLVRDIRAIPNARTQTAGAMWAASTAVLGAALLLAVWVAVRQMGLLEIPRDKSQTVTARQPDSPTPPAQTADKVAPQSKETLARFTLKGRWVVSGDNKKTNGPITISDRQYGPPWSGGLFYAVTLGSASFAFIPVGRDDFSDGMYVLLDKPETKCVFENQIISENQMNWRLTSDDAGRRCSQTFFKSAVLMRG